MGLVNVLLGADAALDDKNDQDETALFLAVKHGQTSAARVLVSAGARVDVCNKHGDTDTALLVASDAGLSDVVGLLVSSKASVFVSNAAGETALARALVNQHVDVDVMRAMVHVRNEDGNTLLSLAAHYRAVDTVKHLLAADASVNVTNKDGKSTQTTGLSCSCWARSRMWRPDN